MAVTIDGSAGVTTSVGAVYNGLQRQTAVTASGTSVDFTGIPSWVDRITVMFNQVSTNGVSPIQIQLGSGSIVTTGYVGSASGGGSGVSSQSSTTGFLATIAIAAANAFSGNITLTNITGNAWVESGVLGTSPSGAFYVSGGAISFLGGTLDRVRITTVNGTDTFDVGTINIIYE